MRRARSRNIKLASNHVIKPQDEYYSHDVSFGSDVVFAESKCS